MGLEVIVRKFGAGPGINRPASLLNNVVNPIGFRIDFIAHKQHVFQQMCQSGAICKVKEVASFTTDRHATRVHFRFVNNEYPESIFENK